MGLPGSGLLLVGLLSEMVLLLRADRGDLSDCSLLCMGVPQFAGGAEDQIQGVHFKACRYSSSISVYWWVSLSFYIHPLHEFGSQPV